jgi:hypothetical protein
MGEFPEAMWSGRLDTLVRARGIESSDSLKAAQELLASPFSRTIQSVNVYLDQQEIK